MRILLIEDNPHEAMLVQYALDELGGMHRMDHVATGDEALARLRAEGTRPDLVLLDLNLETESGFEILARIKGDAAIATTPVVVLTSSDEPRDVRAAYASRANSYVVKPLRVEHMKRVLAAMDRFWGRLARLPNRPTDG